MKKIFDVENYIKLAISKEVRISSQSVNSSNFLFVHSKDYCGSWAWTSNFENSKNPKVLVYGTECDGGILTYIDSENIFNFGKGKNEALVVFIQKLNQDFNICVFSDINGQSEKFFMTATSSFVITAMILTLLEYFNINKTEIISKLNDFEQAVSNNARY